MAKGVSYGYRGEEEEMEEEFVKGGRRRRQRLWRRHREVELWTRIEGRGRGVLEKSMQRNNLNL